MPHLEFYATARDFEQIFEFVFARLPVRVFESYSRYDQNIIEFKILLRLRKDILLDNAMVQLNLYCFSFGLYMRQNKSHSIK